MYFAGTQPESWAFTHWPSPEVSFNISDENFHTCVKFPPVQLGRYILLKAPDSPSSSKHNWRMFMFSKNLALSSKCHPSILVMTQVGVSVNTDEMLGQPFCGKLVRGNVSLHSNSNPYHWFCPSSFKLLLNYISAPGDLVVVDFPFDSHTQCKGMFIRITRKALLDPTLNLEICEIAPGSIMN